MEQARLQEHEALIRGLLEPRAYPHPVQRVERIDTHISTVLLAGDFAYKIKKPVDLGFLDFSTLDRRREACGDELRLNRRTAPELYLGVVPIALSAAGLQVGAGADDAVEYAVRMRRFDPGQTMDHVAARGELTADRVDRLAAVVARLHADAAMAPAGFGSAHAAQQVVVACLAAMRDWALSPSDRARLDALATWSAAAWRALAGEMDERAARGRVRECHGDLHLANIVLLADTPVLFDAIEFSKDLRYIDVISDVAFTFMDLTDVGLSALAWRLVGRYLEHTGDYEGLAVLRYYAVYRALVRAEVALIRVRQPEVRRQVRLREHASFEHYLALAERLAGAGSRRLVVMTGLSGSGKSTVAIELAQHLGGIRIRSDVERKRLFGYGADDPTGGSIYSDEATRRTYDRLEDAARAAISAGVPAVVDAAFLKRGERDRFRALARALDARFVLVSCEAPPDVLRDRVAARHAMGRDPSEADLEVLERQRLWQEPPSTEEGDDGVRIDTGADMASVVERCQSLAADIANGHP